MAEMTLASNILTVNSLLFFNRPFSLPLIKNMATFFFTEAVGGGGTCL